MIKIVDRRFIVTSSYVNALVKFNISTIFSLIFPIFIRFIAVEKMEKYSGSAEILIKWAGKIIKIKTITYIKIDFKITLKIFTCPWNIFMIQPKNPLE